MDSTNFPVVSLLLQGFRKLHERVDIAVLESGSHLARCRGNAFVVIAHLRSLSIAANSRSVGDNISGRVR